MISALGAKRLRALIRFLRDNPAKVKAHFDMDVWFSHEGDELFEDEHHKKPGSKITAKDLHSCGTAACALGWACVVPSLNRAGLKMIFNGCDESYITHHGKSGDEFAIASIVFEMTEQDSSYLFAPTDRSMDTCTPETPEQWVRRAERYLVERGF